jgi:hypothetical protein
VCRPAERLNPPRVAFRRPRCRTSHRHPHGFGVQHDTATRLRQLDSAPNVDDLADVEDRRASVLHALYLLLNEGYHGSRVTRLDDQGVFVPFEERPGDRIQIWFRPVVVLS